MAPRFRQRRRSGNFNQLSDALRNDQRTFARSARKQYDELFPAISSREIILAAKTLQQQRRHSDQNAIAIKVPTRVVRHFEVVNVDQDG